jgi:hypothetical protein
LSSKLAGILAQRIGILAQRINIDSYPRPVNIKAELGIPLA